MKVSELSGYLLDYWVARAEGMVLSAEWDASGTDGVLIGTGEGDLELFAPSTDWAHGGPIIERAEIGVRTLAQLRTFLPGEHCWEASQLHGQHRTTGTSPLEAAMRCLVKARFGSDVPDEVPA